MDWDLRTCARKGHVTYAPDEEQLRAKLTATTPLGEAWRCLRCGSYVLGEPHGHGPADEAPTLLRGRALRSAGPLASPPLVAAAPAAPLGPPRPAPAAWVAAISARVAAATRAVAA